MPTYEWTLYTDGTSDRVADIPENATVVAIDGEPVRGACEGCARYILDKEPFHAWADGIITCSACGGPTEEDIEAARGTMPRNVRDGEWKP